MKYNRFFKVPFWFLTLVPFYSHSIMASENTAKPYAQEKPLAESLSVSAMIDKLKQGGFISEQDEKISNENLKEFHAHYSPDDEDWWSFIVLYLEKQDLFPDLIQKTLAKEQQENLSPLALNNLGILYKEGIGVDQDLSKAVKFYTQAADQENVFAQCSLSLMYRKGEGVDPDPQQELKLLKQATAQRYALAQFILGIRYYLGDSIEKDLFQAFKFIKKVANQGFSIAQYKLGEMYFKGEGVTKNEPEAFRWILQAAEQGKKIAHLFLADQFMNGHPIARSYQVNILSYLHQDAEQEDTNAQCILGVLYKGNCGIERNDLEAFKWLKRAAKKGDPASQYRLGVMYSGDYKIEQNKQKLLKWLTKSAEQNFSKAQYIIGTSHLLANNPQQGIELLSKAAHQGLADAQAEFGKTYAPFIKMITLENNAQQIYGYIKHREAIDPLLQAEGNAAAACTWFQQAADQNHSKGTFYLGLMYEFGAGVEQSSVKALNLYMQAQRLTSDPMLIELIKYKIKPVKNVQTTPAVTLLTSKQVISDNISNIADIFYIQETINNPKANFKESASAIFFLRSIYTDIKSFRQDCLGILNAFTQPGFMIDCLEPIDQELKSELATGSFIKSYTLKNCHFLTFGPENVKQADKLMDLLGEEKTLGQQAITRLLGINTKVLKSLSKTKSSLENTEQLQQKIASFNRKISEKNQQIIKIQNKFETSCLENVTPGIYMDLKEKQDFINSYLKKAKVLQLESQRTKDKDPCSKLKIELECLQELAAIPAQLSLLLNSEHGARNGLFLEENPYLKPEEGRVKSLKTKIRKLSRLWEKEDA